MSRLVFFSVLLVSFYEHLGNDHSLLPPFTLLLFLLTKILTKTNHNSFFPHSSLVLLPYLSRLLIYVFFNSTSSLLKTMNHLESLIPHYSFTCPHLTNLASAFSFPLSSHPSAYLFTPSYHLSSLFSFCHILQSISPPPLIHFTSSRYSSSPSSLPLSFSFPPPPLPLPPPSGCLLISAASLMATISLIMANRSHPQLPSSTTVNF